MTTALEISAVFLLAATLPAAAMFLAAFQLGRLITRDDEQREVAPGPRVPIQDDRSLRHECAPSTKVNCANAERDAGLHGLIRRGFSAIHP